MTELAIAMKKEFKDFQKKMNPEELAKILLDAFKSAGYYIDIEELDIYHRLVVTASEKDNSLVGAMSKFYTKEVFWYILSSALYVISNELITMEELIKKHGSIPEFIVSSMESTYTLAARQGVFDE